MKTNVRVWLGIDALVATVAITPTAHADNHLRQSPDNLTVASGVDKALHTNSEADSSDPRARARLIVADARLRTDVGRAVIIRGSSVGVPQGVRVRLQRQLDDGAVQTIARGEVQSDGSWSMRVRNVELGATQYRAITKVERKPIRSRIVTVTGYQWSVLSEVGRASQPFYPDEHLIDGRVFPTQLYSNSSFRPDTLLPGALTIPEGCLQVELGGGFGNGGDGTMVLFAGTNLENFLRVDVPNASGAIGIADVPRQQQFTVIATEVRWTRYNGTGTSLAYGGGQAYCSFVLE